MFQKCSKPNSGLTLVEVIFSLVLVGTLMVTLLLAHRRNTDQLALAGKQLEAIDALDQSLRCGGEDLYAMREQPEGMWRWFCGWRYLPPVSEKARPLLTLR